MGQPIRFAFLVYLGRSGSTFLAHRLDSISRDLLVTPELNFIVTAAVAGDAEMRALSGDELVQFVRRDLQIANLGLPAGELEARARGCAGQGVRALAESLVLAHSAKRGREPRVVVVKKSVAHLGAERLIEVFPEALFLHIRRDGRAVVSSLIHTESVYDPGHMLGRGDPVHAARLWVRQLRSVETLAKRHPRRVLEVEYESLLHAPAAELERLRTELESRLDVELRPPSGDAKFEIPEREQKLHRLVTEPADEARAAGWRTELTRAQGIAVEAIARPWLARSGYQAHFLAGASAAEVASARVSLELAHQWLMAKHYAWRAGVLARLALTDPGLAAARLREAFFQRFGAD